MQKNVLAILAQVLCTMTWAVCLAWTVLQLLRSWSGRSFEADIAIAVNIVGGYVVARAITKIIPVLLSRPGSAH
jgi:hypothetical protein